MEIKKSGFQPPLTIKEVIESIHERKYLLPAIQREFVWSSDQIIKLFDSLMKEYTIGSFLFWTVKKEKVNDFQFYEFIRNFHERDSTHNPKANVTSEENITSILDGQQRLSSLYVGLRGTYAYKIPYKRWTSPDAFPKRKLYLNLLSKSPEFDLTYDFRFLTNTQALKKDENAFWFEIGKILEFESLRDVNKFLRDNGLIENEFSEKCLWRLFEVLREKGVINYYLETSQELDKVLNIFIRVNSGGTLLSYSDLLLSIATAQWKSKDAREEITSFVDNINKIGEGFYFDKDYVLKSCLVLSDFADIAFKVDNFNTKNMKTIEENWENMTSAIKITTELIASFGYNFQTLTSANALIPISYYVLNLDNPSNFVQSEKYKEERKKIRKWLVLSLLKRSFGGQPDSVLRPIRAILRNHKNGFPFNEILNKFKGHPKSIIFTDDDIENLLFYKYGQIHTFSVLSLLYPTVDFRNRFHQDHIFPKSFFRISELRKRNIPESEQNFYLENYNYLGNLQLLEGLPNEEKSSKDFVEWLEETYHNEEDRKNYMKKNFIPKNIDLSFDNFKQFFEEREKLILQKLKEILPHFSSS